MGENEGVTGSRQKGSLFTYLCPLTVPRFKEKNHHLDPDTFFVKPSKSLLGPFKSLLKQFDLERKSNCTVLQYQ